MHFAMSASEDFELPVTHLGEELLLPAGFSARGYTHRISMEVNGVLLHFEPDEERKYRALMDDPSAKTNVNPALVQAIIDSLEKHFGHG